MKTLFRLLFLVGMLSAPGTATYAQEGISKEKQEKIQAKKDKDLKKQRARKEKTDRKRHLRNQDKETRKRIKRNQRRADKHGKGAPRDPFLRRLFGSKH
jgi:hypothetical protein